LINITEEKYMKNFDMTTVADKLALDIINETLVDIKQVQEQYALGNYTTIKLIDRVISKVESLTEAEVAPEGTTIQWHASL
jgi:hypothetical protein